MPIKLIVSDLDGTLLTDNTTLSKETIDTLRLAIKKGYQVVIATGRVHGAALSILGVLELDLPIISANGCQIQYINADKPIYTRYLENDILKSIIDFFKDTKGGFFEACDATSYKYFREDELSREFERYSKIPGKFNNDPYDILNSPTIKCVYYGTKEHIDSMDAIIRDKFGKITTVVRTARTLIEIMPLNTSKGSMLQYWAENLGIKPDEIAAFGDEENDISMLKYAGMPIAMKNARIEVKENAKYIALSNDENGVAHAIIKYIFDNE